MSKGRNICQKRPLDTLKRPIYTLTMQREGESPQQGVRKREREEGEKVVVEAEVGGERRGARGAVGAGGLWQEVQHVTGKLKEEEEEENFLQETEQQLSQLDELMRRLQVTLQDHIMRHGPTTTPPSTHPPPPPATHAAATAHIHTSHAGTQTMEQHAAVRGEGGGEGGRGSGRGGGGAPTLEMGSQTPNCQEAAETREGGGKREGGRGLHTPPCNLSPCRLNSSVRSERFGHFHEALQRHQMALLRCERGGSSLLICSRFLLVCSGIRLASNTDAFCVFQRH